MSTLFGPDTFTGADGTNLDGVNSWHQSGTTWEINSNKARLSTTSASLEFLTNSTSLGTADYEIEVSLNIPNNAASHGVVYRYVDASNLYLARVNGNTTLQLYKEVTGSYTQIGSNVTVSWTTNTLRAGAQGTTQRVYMDGVQQISQTDSAFSSEGDFGLHDGAGGLLADRGLFDNATVYDFGGGILYSQLEHATLRGSNRGVLLGVR